MSSPRLTGAAMVVAASIAFSAKAVIIKLAYRHGVDAVTLLAMRMLLAAPFFALLAFWVARHGEGAPIGARDGLAVAGLGIIGYYLASLFDFFGLQYITAALERLVLFVYPTFVVLMSAIWLRRQVTSRDVFALAVTYLGVLLVFVNDLATQRGNVALGTFWVLLSALCYAAYLVMSGQLVKRVGSVRLACYAGLVSSVAVVLHFLATREALILLQQPAAVWWLSLLMATVATVLPIVMMTDGIRRIGSSHASMLGAIGPVSTIVLGAIFLGEPVTAIQLAGAALVLLGVLAISLHKPALKPAEAVASAD
jgi:drug/metabolite transporter (DMT)-like permease